MWEGYALCSPSYRGFLPCTTFRKLRCTHPLRTAHTLSVLHTPSSHCTQAYSPDDLAKTNENRVVRRLTAPFEPTCFSGPVETPQEVAELFVQFREMMLHGEYGDLTAGSPTAPKSSAANVESTPVAQSTAGSRSSTGSKHARRPSAKRKSATKEPTSSGKRGRRGSTKKPVGPTYMLSITATDVVIARGVVASVQ